MTGLLAVTFSAVALLLIAGCGSDGPERAPVRTATAGPTIGGDVSLAGTVALLVGEEYGELHLDDISPDGQTMLLRVSNPAGGAACSKLAAVTLTGETRTVAADASVVRFGEVAGHSVFSPDGSQVAYLGTADCTNRVWADLKTVPVGGGEATLLDTSVLRVWAWAPDGAVLYSRADGPGLWSVSPGGAPRKIAEGSPLDVSANGQVIAFSDPAGIAFQAVGGEKISVPAVPPDASRAFLSPDGAISPALTGDEEGRIISFGFVRTATGETAGGLIDAATLTAQNLEPPYSVAWAPDGSLLYAQGGRSPGAPPPPAYALSPDGSFVGSLEKSGTGLGGGLIARANLLFFESGNQIHVGVLSGSGTAAADAQAQAEQLTQTFPEPVRLTFNVLP